MSFNIYWRPLPPPTAEQLPWEFKTAIAQRWFGHDGSLRGEVVLTRRSHTELAYLAGLKHGAGKAGNDEVIEAVDALMKGVDEHGVIRIWIGDPDD